MAELDRRQCLTVTGAMLSAGLAGCSSITGGDGGGGPDYETDQKEELLLSAEVFPDGWVRNDEINENFDAVFANEDESIVVLTTVEIGEDSGEAKDAYDSAESGFSNTNEIDIGNKAFWATRNEEIAYTIFRHSNALGQSAALRESGAEIQPDQSRSQEYAREMYQSWQDL